MKEKYSIFKNNILLRIPNIFKKYSTKNIYYLFIYRLLMYCIYVSMSIKNTYGI